MKETQETCSKDTSQEEEKCKGKLPHYHYQATRSYRVEEMLAQLVRRVDAQDELLRKIKFHIINIIIKLINIQEQFSNRIANLDNYHNSLSKCKVICLERQNMEKKVHQILRNSEYSRLLHHAVTLNQTILGK